MYALANLIYNAFNIYIFLLIAAVVLGLLVSFNVVNSRHPFVNGIGRFLFAITEPALRPIRRILPRFGPFDISPVVLILVLYFIRDFIVVDVILGSLAG